MRSTFIAKPADVERKWYIMDAEGQTLGRFASEVAKILRGKHKPIFTPHVDTGDHVIIINAEKIVFTGKKLDQKMYRHHTGYCGGLRETTLRNMMDTKPEEVIKAAVKGMIPHNSLGRQIFTKLRVYVGPEHDQQAQKPEVLVLKI